MIDQQQIDALVATAVLEDLPQGDVTTDGLGLKQKFGHARVVAKEDLVLSGAVPFEKVFAKIAPEAKLQWHVKEGAHVLAKQVVCTITGNLVPVLKAERTALNFLGHLSGVATLTRSYVLEVMHTHCQILDTRKTLPGLRALEKQAVLHGGGHNHRPNLSSAILLKENHLRVAGGIRAAVSYLRKNSDLPIEVETSTLTEVEEAIDCRVNIILLDNMNNDTIAAALKIIPSSIKTEASGNMNLQRVRSVANLGVNYISIGALTHSAPCADLSMLFDWAPLTD